MTFRREQIPQRSHCVTLRVTDEQNQLLDRLVEAIDDCRSKGEVLRAALDYWLENSPDVKRALRRQ